MKIDTNVIRREIDLLCKRVYKVKSLTEYRKLKLSIQNLIDVYDLLTGNCEIINIPEIKYYEKLMYGNDYKKFVSFYGEYIERLDLYKKQTEEVLKSYNGFINLRDTFYPNQRSYSKSDFISIIESFLNEFDEKMLKTFREMCANNQIDIDTPKIVTGDVTYEIASLSKAYVLVDNEGYNLEDMLAIVHELGHGMSYSNLRKLSFKQTQLSNSDFNYEIFSLFLESVFLEYFRKNNINQTDLLSSENKLLNYIKESFLDLEEVNDGIDELGLNYLLDDESDTFDDTLIATALKYGYGGLVALEFSEQYKSDRKDTKRRLHLFDTSQGLIKYDDILSIALTSEEELLSCKVLRKRLENHNKSIRRKIKL